MSDRVQVWPDNLTRSVSSSFTLGSLSGSVQPLFLAAPSIFADPFDQRWVATITSPPLGERETSQKYVVLPSYREVEGRIAKLRGMNGLLRLFDPDNVQPAYNLDAMQSSAKWSDDSTWSDGSQWVSGDLPPSITVDETAHEGEASIVVRGLPESVARVFRFGDRYEALPNGNRLNFGAYHIITEECRSNASGKTRIYCEPGLRIGLNPGDQILLDRPTSVFSLIDDKQGVVTRNQSGIGNFGFSAIESLLRD